MLVRTPVIRPEIRAVRRALQGFAATVLSARPAPGCVGPPIGQVPCPVRDGSTNHDTPRMSCCSRARRSACSWSAMSCWMSTCGVRPRESHRKRQYPWSESPRNGAHWAARLTLPRTRSRWVPNVPWSDASVAIRPAASFARSSQETGIDGNGLIEVADRPTTVKTRIMARHHQVARYDMRSSNTKSTKHDGRCRSSAGSSS